MTVRMMSVAVRMIEDDEDVDNGGDGVVMEMVVMVGECGDGDGGDNDGDGGDEGDDGW